MKTNDFFMNYQLIKGGKKYYTALSRMEFPRQVQKLARGVAGHGQGKAGQGRAGMQQTRGGITKEASREGQET